MTTVSPGGVVNLAPMGPIVDESMTRLILRPFQSSTTFANLQDRPEGVFHVLDDVLLLARAAIGGLDPLPETFPAETIDGVVVADACRWYEFRVEACDTTDERAELTARVVHSGRLRDLLGFQRARHAVVEAAILATRVHLLPAEELRDQFQKLAVIVEKTAGPSEREAFGLLSGHVETHLSRPQTIEVTTGARLHFGLLALETKGARQFGGAGLMIDGPGVRLRARPAERDEVLGPHQSLERVRDVLARLRQASSVEGPQVRLQIEEVIPPHAGLGSGTQLELSVARVLAGLNGEWPAVTELADRVGRGNRSAIGLHGFAHGGLLVDSGRDGRGAVGPVVARVEVPGMWRFLLVRPRQGQGLSGEAESDAFHRLPPMEAATTAELSRLLIQEILPAVQQADLKSAGEGLFEYGRISGEVFGEVQGGTIADPGMARLVEWAREEGVRGVGQSSWGPTIWMLCPGPAEAEALAVAVSDFAGPEMVEVTIASPRNRGADVG